MHTCRQNTCVHKVKISKSVLRQKRKCKLVAGVAHICNPSTQRQRQENYMEFEASLDYTVGSYLKTSKKQIRIIFRL